MDTDKAQYDRRRKGSAPLTPNEMAVKRVAKAVEVGGSPILQEPCIDFLRGALVSEVDYHVGFLGIVVVCS